MAQKRIERRKRRFIDRPTQGKVALIVISYVLLYIFILALFIFVPLAYQMQTKTISSELQHVANAFIHIHEHFWPATLMVLLIIGLHSIRISHRIAGPVFRFKDTMKKIRMKDLSTDILLRKGDFFADLMEEINKTTKSIRENIKEIKEKDEKLHHTILNLTEKLKTETVSNGELKELVLSISKDEENLQQLLKGFKVKRKDG